MSVRQKVADEMYSTDVDVMYQQGYTPSQINICFQYHQHETDYTA